LSEAIAATMKAIGAITWTSAGSARTVMTRNTQIA
jgi:hypothetical protein